MLIKTITMETEDTQLFSKTSPLLPAAVELAFHTVNCSALNAEELRRDNGIEVCTPQIKKKMTRSTQNINDCYVYDAVDCKLCHSLFTQVLLEALSRCVGVLTASSKSDDMAVQVNVKI